MRHLGNENESDKEREWVSKGTNRGAEAWRPPPARDLFSSYLHCWLLQVTVVQVDGYASCTAYEFTSTLYV